MKETSAARGKFTVIIWPFELSECRPGNSNLRNLLGNAINVNNLLVTPLECVSANVSVKHA